MAENKQTGDWSSDLIRRVAAWAALMVGVFCAFPALDYILEPGVTTSGPAGYLAAMSAHLIALGVAIKP